MTSLQVSSEGSTGSSSLVGPSGVTPHPRTVDTAAAALLFAPPALSGEFLPASLWAGTTLIRSCPPPPDPASTDAVSWAQLFSRAVDKACGDADSIGVQLSGGLDSLAVLVHAIAAARRGGRRVIAFTHDLRDDQGNRAGNVARQLLSALELPCEHVILDPREHAEPVWSPAGPRLDAIPDANAALAQRASEHGVDVLLNGDGADEILGMPRFATTEIRRANGTPAAVRYLRDVARGAPGVPGEALAVVARTLPAWCSARLYWASNWPDWCSFEPPPLVAATHRTMVADWSRAWVNAQIVRHVHSINVGWAYADAYDSVWPHDPIPAAAAVPESSPFLEPDFLAAALNAPLASRYDATLTAAYQRCKAAVIALFPATMRPHLPQRKQYFRTALAASVARPITAERAVAAGIVDPDALVGETDTAALMTTRALETWLAGAQRYGAAIPGVCSASAPPLNPSEMPCPD